MSRRAHVVRNTSNADTPTPRELGGTFMYCSIEQSAFFDETRTLLVCSIPLIVPQNYQRVFLSGMVNVHIGGGV